jgi:hypothetical protein
MPLNHRPREEQPFYVLPFIVYESIQILVTLDSILSSPLPTKLYFVRLLVEESVGAYSQS